MLVGSVEMSDLRTEEETGQVETSGEHRGTANKAKALGN